MVEIILTFAITIVSLFAGFVMGRCTVEKPVKLKVPSVKFPMPKSTASPVADEIPDYDRAIAGDDDGRRISTI